MSTLKLHHPPSLPAPAVVTCGPMDKLFGRPYHYRKALPSVPLSDINFGSLLAYVKIDVTPLDIALRSRDSRARADSGFGYVELTFRLENDLRLLRGFHNDFFVAEYQEYGPDQMAEQFLSACSTAQTCKSEEPHE